MASTGSLHFFQKMYPQTCACAVLPFCFSLIKMNGPLKTQGHKTTSLSREATRCLPRRRRTCHFTNNFVDPIRTSVRGEVLAVIPGTPLFGGGICHSSLAADGRTSLGWRKLQTGSYKIVLVHRFVTALPMPLVSFLQHHISRTLHALRCTAWTALQTPCSSSVVTSAGLCHFLPHILPRAIAFSSN